MPDRSRGSIAGTRTAQWTGFAVRYALAVVSGHFVWEIFQLPLYTIYWERSACEIAFALIHCTAGDLLISLSMLVAAIAASGLGPTGSPRALFARVATTAIALGIAYTIYSEWYNTKVTHSWIYSPLMPLLPPFDTGLSPLLQWAVVPTVAFYWLRPEFERPEVKDERIAP
jgi:hypothetical protein